MNLPHADFWRLHQANRKTARYQALRRKKLEQVGYRCCVCGLGYLQSYTKWQLQMDHVRYRDAKGLLFGREQLSDFRVCCPIHHEKGVRSQAAVASYRRSYLWLKVLTWACFAPFRLAWWFLRLFF